jgi:hypothetical protein
VQVDVIWNWPPFQHNEVRFSILSRTAANQNLQKFDWRNGHLFQIQSFNFSVQGMLKAGAISECEPIAPMVLKLATAVATGVGNLARGANAQAEQDSVIRYGSVAYDARAVAVEQYLSMDLRAEGDWAKHSKFRASVKWTILYARMKRYLLSLPHGLK